MADHYDERGNLLVNPSGNAYGDPIHLWQTPGPALAAVSAELDLGGYNYYLLDVIKTSNNGAGTWTVKPQSAQASGGTYKGVKGMSPTAFTTVAELTLSVAQGFMYMLPVMSRFMKISISAPTGGDVYEFLADLIPIYRTI